MKALRLLVQLVIIGTLFACSDDFNKATVTTTLSVEMASPQRYITRSAPLDEGKAVWKEGDVIHLGMTLKNAAGEEVANTRVVGTHTRGAWEFVPRELTWPTGAVSVSANAWYVAGNAVSVEEEGVLRFSAGRWGYADVLYSAAAPVLREETIKFTHWTHPFSRLRVQACPGYAVRVEGMESAGEMNLYGKDTAMVWNRTVLSARADKNGNAFFYGRWKRADVVSVYLDTLSSSTPRYAQTMAEQSVCNRSYTVETLPREEKIDGKMYSLIYTALDLKNFADKVNTEDMLNLGACAKFMADIDLTDLCAEGEGWVRIVNNTVNRYVGTILGNDKKIIGLRMCRQDKTSQGFINGTGRAAVIRDLTLVNPSITGMGDLAPFVCTNAGTLINCHVVAHPDSVIVSGKNTEEGRYVSGLVARNTVGTIISCSSSGKMISTEFAGGLVGFNSGEIRASYSSCTMIGTMTGGLVGLTNKGTMIASYATGSAAAGLFYKVSDPKYLKIAHCVTTQPTICPDELEYAENTCAGKLLGDIFGVFSGWSEVNVYWEDISGEAPRQKKQP